MLRRFLLIALSPLLCLTAVADQETREAFEHAQQNTSATRQETRTVFDQAAALARSREFVDQMDREANQALNAGEASLAKPLPRLPEPSPQLLERARTDIGRLLKQAESGASSHADLPGGREEKSGPQLYLFVSFSMPEVTLKRLLRQAIVANATLVLRGLVEGDLAKTKEKIAEVLETDAMGHSAIQGGFAIDPTLFERFQITAVPTFVLTNAPAGRCTENHCPAPDHARLSGDITLAYALETMAREAPAMRNSAETLRLRMKEGG